MTDKDVRPASDLSDGVDEAPFGTGEEPGALSGDDFVPKPSTDEFGAVGRRELDESPFQHGALDAYRDFANFSRKDLMRAVFDTSTRYFQSVGYPDGKVPDQKRALELLGQVTEHAVIAAVMCFSDTTMEKIFASMTELAGGGEDPWRLAVNREYVEIQERLSEG
ncbi:hypothetical protein GCM10019059_36730 [Camelimonas fluminis]|uniref:Uncharacterized protein n=1 Tax=Camelimonas fluminis TaxID=1576911 RepID=A0ABV7UI12_9HYPH|nr:hypothetical protein [Camelimonas fluminis]GHE73850.1 hypothetical protein GCM10019059_36730 [Camelimonas fluminis]